MTAQTTELVQTFHYKVAAELNKFYMKWCGHVFSVKEYNAYHHI